MDYHSKLSRGHKPDYYQLGTADFKPFDRSEDDSTVIERVNVKYEPATGHKAASGHIDIKFKKEDVKEGMTYESFAKLIEQELREALSKKTKATLKKKAEKRGLTPGSVYAEYKKGLAAWASSGSRRGMSQHQWAMARVNAATPSKSWAIVKKSKAKKK